VKPPNIVFLFSDQQRWDTLGCYGQALPTTPHLDAMAGEGTRFEHTFTCQPVCGPARAALQTGKYPTEVRCHTNHRMLPGSEKTLAHHLGDVGYETAYIGKWHLASYGPEDGPNNYQTRPVPPARRGGYRDFWLAADALEFTSHGYDGHMFDTHGARRDFPIGRYRVDAQTDWVLEYLRSRDGRRPFLLFVSYLEPHHQNDRGHYEGPHGSRDRFGRFEVPGDLAGLPGDWQDEYPDYLGCVASLDENVGRIRAELSALELEEDTLVVYTSDHGTHFRTRNDEYKRSCHDGCIRIPLIVNGPGFRGGRVLDSMTSLIDLPPTLLTAAGVTPHRGMRGRALQGLVDGSAADWDEEVFLQISESQCGRALRTKRWKYSVRDPDTHPWEVGSDRYVEDFLYDLEADPHERENLVSSSEHAETRKRLAVALVDRMVAVGEAAPRIESTQGSSVVG
jgi:arylsulfatase A-like enzyme